MDQYVVQYPYFLLADHGVVLCTRSYNNYPISTRKWQMEFKDVIRTVVMSSSGDQGRHR